MAHSFLLAHSSSVAGTGPLGNHGSQRILRFHFELQQGDAFVCLCLGENSRDESVLRRVCCAAQCAGRFHILFENEYMELHLVLHRSTNLSVCVYN